MSASGGGFHERRSWRTGKQMATATVAEFACSAVSFGALAYIDKLCPKQMEKVKQFVAEECIQPLLVPIETIEKYTFANIEGDVFKERQKLHPRLRAKEISNTLIDYGLAFGAGGLAKFGTRFGLESMLGIDPGHKELGKSILCDEGVHFGSTLLMNCPLFADKTRGAIDTVACVLGKCFGMPDETARRMANGAILWEVPNMIGFLAQLGMIYRHNANHPLSK